MRAPRLWTFRDARPTKRQALAVRLAHLRLVEYVHDWYPRGRGLGWVRYTPVWQRRWICARCQQHNRLRDRWCPTCTLSYAHSVGGRATWQQRTSVRRWRIPPWLASKVGVGRGEA